MTQFRTHVDALSLYTVDEDNDLSLHYQQDADLYIHAKNARGGGDSAALVLIELGIDGNQAHVVRLDFGVMAPDDDAFVYSRGGDEVRALTDAINALTAVRDRLEQIASQS